MSDLCPDLDPESHFPDPDLSVFISQLVLLYNLLFIILWPPLLSVVDPE
jgi:hypothetical protein